MGAPKGNKFSPGRPKGSKDKLSRSLKKLVIDTMEKLEKEKKSLYDVAVKDPEWFYANFVKPMLPKDIELSPGGEEPIEIIVKHVKSK